MLKADTLVQDRYRIIRPINKGNMGAVYLAADLRLGNEVALKETFSTGDDAELRAQFRREARLLAHLRHPSLPRVIDIDDFSDGSGQFLVMDYIVGKDLQELMRDQSGPFPVDKVLGWADQLLEVLTHLHTQDEPVIHRDIKPANIKLTPQGRLILLDFGLAKGSTPSLQISLHGMTEAYAPLEQVNGQGTDARSDLYALAATLYHLMTGELPRLASQRNQIKWQGRVDPLIPANHHNALVPAEVAQVLTQAMALEADDRPDSAAEMRAALRQAQAEAAERQVPKEAAAFRQRDDQRTTTPVVRQKTSASRPKAVVAIVAGVVLLAVVIWAIVVMMNKPNSASPYPESANTSSNAPANRQPPDTPAPARLKASVFKTPNKVTEVSFSDDGRTLASAGEESVIRMWQPDSKRQLPGHQGNVKCVALSPDGRLVASSSNNTIILQSTSDGQILKTLTGHKDMVFSVGFSGDGQTLYSASYDKTIKLWRVSDGSLVKTVNTPEKGYAIVTVSPDLRLIGFYRGDGNFKLWSLEQDSLIRMLDGKVPAVNCGGFSADGQMLALGSGDGKVELWGVSDGRLIKSLGQFEAKVMSIAFSSNNQVLAAGFENGAIRLWRIRDGQLLTAFTNHTASVNSLTFSADGRTLASGSNDKTVRISDVPEK